MELKTIVFSDGYTTKINHLPLVEELSSGDHFRDFTNLFTKHGIPVNIENLSIFSISDGLKTVVNSVEQIPGLVTSGYNIVFKVLT